MTTTTYPFATKTPGNNRTFNNLPIDGTRNAMTGMLGNGPMTTDISGSPVVSPASISNAGVTTINIPASAAQISFIASGNTVNVSESDNTVATRYVTLPIGLVVTMDVAKCATLYLKANAGVATLSFWFN